MTCLVRQGSAVSLSRAWDLFYDLHPSQQEQPTGDLSCDRATHDLGGVGDIVNPAVFHPEQVHYIGKNWKVDMSKGDLEFECGKDIQVVMEPQQTRRITPGP